MRRKVITIGIVGCLVALMAAGLVVAQPQGRGGQRGGQRGGPGGFDPARMRQMMEQRMKGQLGCTDDEWKVLGPRVTKVMNLSRQARGGGGMARMFMGRRGGQGGRPGDQQGNRQADRQGGRRGPGGGEPSAVDTAGEALQTALQNASATPDDIKAKLTALRGAREKAKQELAVAQKQLKEVLTLRQEAQLVMMGMLD